MLSLHTIWAIASKDLRQFFRDFTLMLFILLMPVAQLILLAMATGQGYSNLNIALMDQDHSSQSRRFIALLTAATDFKIVAYPETWDEGISLLEQGEINAFIVIPHGLGEALIDPSGDGVSIQLLVDGSNNLTGGVAVASVGTVVRKLVAHYPQASAGGIVIHPQMRYNPTVSGRTQTIPIQVGFIIYQVTLGVAILGLTRERELGTLEQLMVTPIRYPELLIGKALPPLLIGVVDFLIMYAVARFIFNIPMLGSMAFLTFGTLIFISVQIVWAMLISAISSTQQQAILLGFIQSMIDVALSGYIVPVQDMPVVLQTAAQIVPLHHYMIFIRSVMLKGAGFDVLWPRLAIMAGVMLFYTVIAVRVLGRRLN